ncbi:dihydroorotate dehydrogenase electron transfer subunit [candidate division KSB1 bacterium]|nr:dihydroorotate dehydrogenase electron transfer subunit [candidate division KSB1 bacterium]
MKDKKRAIAVPIQSFNKITDEIYSITLYDQLIAGHAHSGQFINVLVPRANDILWRRPFGIHRINADTGTFDIVFKVVGRGTKALTTIKTGDKLDIIGPLGNHFTCPPDINEAIMVAGGLGIAPFPLFIQDTGNKNIQYTLFYGTKSKNQFCSLDFFNTTVDNRFLATEDGSFGAKGFITDSLERYLKGLTAKDGKYIYVCGPTPLLARVKQLAHRFNIRAQVSVETMMACGFGACMGCPVPLEKPAKDGRKYLLACKDGPVFNMEDIVFDE